MKGRKGRILALAMALVFSLGATSVPVFAQDATLTIATVNAEQGGTVGVDITLENNPGFSAMTIRVAFAEGLTLTAYECQLDESTAFFEGMPIEYANEGGYFFAVWITDDDNVEGDGAILTLTFNVAADAAGLLEVTATFENAADGDEVPTNAENEPLNIEIVNGGVNLDGNGNDRVRVLIGDVNRDGIVNSVDILNIRMFWIDHPMTPEAFTPEVADVNGDGIINSVDILNIRMAFIDHPMRTFNLGDYIYIDA